MNGNCKTVISTSAKLMGSANLSHCVTLENHGTMLLQVGECSITAVLMCCGLFSNGVPFHLGCCLVLILQAQSDRIYMLT